MAATVAFQQECVASELPVYSTVAAAATSIARFITWQSRRAEFAAAK